MGETKTEYLDRIKLRVAIITQSYGPGPNPGNSGAREVFLHFSLEYFFDSSYLIIYITISI